MHSAAVEVHSNDPDSPTHSFAISGEGTPSEDDHSDRFQFATEIATGVDIVGTLEKRGDEDWFTFTLDEAKQITVQSATDVDVKGGLYDARGRFIESDDDGGDGDNFLISRILEAGQYHLKVRASNRRDTGAYTFSIATAVAVIEPEILVTGNNVEIVDGATDASVEDGTDIGNVLVGDRRWRYFVVKNDGSSTLELGEVSVSEGTGFAVSRRPTKLLRPGKATWLRLSFTSESEGEKQATVSIASNDADENPFTFVVSANATVPEPDDHGDSADDATEIVGGTVEGVIGGRRDRDFFSFTISDAMEVIVETTGELDTYGRIYNADGRRVASDNNDGEGKNFRIVKALSAGIYYVRVEARGFDTGAYTLSVSTSVPSPEMDVSGYAVVNARNWWKRYERVEIPSGSEASSELGTDFGTVDVASERTRRLTFKVRNSGSSALELTGDPTVTLTGEGAAVFSVKRQPSKSVRAGRATYFRLAFDPSEVGVFSATVSIANNDADENPYTFKVSGEGMVTEEAGPEGQPGEE